MTVLPQVTHGLSRPTRAGRDTSAGKSMIGAVEEALVAVGLREWERNALVTFVGEFGYSVELAVKMPTGERVAVKLMWQASSGTAEMKFLWHLAHLGKAVKERNVGRAYLVLGGDGFTRKQQFLSGVMAPLVTNGSAVGVVDLGEFLRVVKEAGTL